MQALTTAPHPAGLVYALERDGNLEGTEVIASEWPLIGL